MKTEFTRIHQSVCALSVSIIAWRLGAAKDAAALELARFIRRVLED